MRFSLISVNNILSRSSEAFYWWGGTWVSHKWFSLLLHLAILLALVTGVCWFAYSLGSRNRYTQIVLLVLSTMLALLIPVEQLQVGNKYVRTFLFILSVVAVTTLSRVYPRWVFAELGLQARLRACTVVLIALLLIGNFFVG